MNRSLAERYEADKAALKVILQQVRTTSICVDCWTKKGLTSSYLGISARFFDPDKYEVCHAILDVIQVEHPHTGKVLAEIITRTLSKWGLGKEKVLIVISDNGSNMTKAVKLMQEEAKQNDNDKDDDTEEEEDEAVQAGNDFNELDTSHTTGDEIESQDGNNSENDNGENEAANEGVNDQYFLSEVEMPYRHMPCLAHTIQLLIKPIIKENYGTVMTAARKLC